MVFFHLKSRFSDARFGRRSLSRSRFDYALGLNRLGFDMLRRMQTKRSDRRQFTLNAHFVRVHRSFQSALILAERGQVPDARVVLRSAVEGAIAINALAKDEGFVDQMVEAHHRSQRTLARVPIAKFGASWPSEDIAIMNAAIGVADAYEASKGKELTDIKWEQVAEKHCPNLYQFLYRNLSSDGTHATVNSLERFLVADERGEVDALQRGSRHGWACRGAEPCQLGVPMVRQAICRNQWIF